MHKRLIVIWLTLGCVGALASTATVKAQTHGGTVEQRLEALEARVAALERHEHLRDISPPATAAPVPHATQPVPAAPPAPAAPPRPAAVDWNALRRGMSRQQVVNALGNPDSRQVRPMTETWLYPGDRSVQFDRNGTLDTWTGQ